MLRQLFGIGLVCLISLSLLGCGQRLTEVRGQVTYRGQPLPGATVSFVPTQGQIATGVTDVGGHFTLETGRRPGAAVGEYKVCVTKFSPASLGSRVSAAEIKKMKRYQGGKVPAPLKSEIPEKYGHPNQSGLEAVVTGNPLQAAFAFSLTD